jgi:hypothetical protein
MRDGEVALDVNRKFQELLGAVFETGQKGKLTLTIDVKPSKLAMGGAVIEVETNHDCKVRKPELGIGRSLFFVTKDGALSRDNPAQAAMFQEEVTQQHG